MKWLLSLIGLPSPYALLTYLAVGLGLLSFGAYEGWHEKSIRDQAELASAEQRTIVQMKAADQITYQVSIEADRRLIEIQTVTLNLVQNVRNYVSPKADAACVVPRGFVRLHDEAATGRVSGVPIAAGQSDDAASGVELSQVGSTVAGNYGSCRADAARLDALQKWAVEQRDLGGKAR